MKLHQMRKVLGDSAYMVVAHEVKTDDWKIIMIDYCNAGNSDFSRALDLREQWEKRKNKVKYIRYNSAEQCNEISIDLLD